MRWFLSQRVFSRHGRCIVALRVLTRLQGHYKVVIYLWELYIFGVSILLRFTSVEGVCQNIMCGEYHVSIDMVMVSAIKQGGQL